MSLCFVTFPYGVPGQVWYLIVSIPGSCLLLYLFRDSKIVRVVQRFKVTVSVFKKYDIKICTSMPSPFNRNSTEKYHIGHSSVEFRLKGNEYITWCLRNREIMYTTEFSVCTVIRIILLTVYVHILYALLCVLYTLHMHFDVYCIHCIIYSRFIPYNNESNRGSYMSVHVLLILLHEFGNRDKMRGLPNILSFFRNA